MAGTVGMTQKAHLKNPEVLKALLEADLEMSYLNAHLKFGVISTSDDTLVGQAGDRINVVAYNYLGSAEDVAEGEEISVERLQATEKISPVIKKSAKGLSISDEALLTAYGDPYGEALKQIQLSLRDKMDKDILAELNKAILTHDASLGGTDGTTPTPIEYSSILKGVGKFQDEEDGRYVLFIHPNQKVDIMSDKMFELANNLKDEFLTEGAIGRIAGCDVIVSRRVPFATDKYTNFICKPEAVKVLTKKGVQIEVERKAKTKSNEIYADTHYVCWLEFGDRVVKLITGAGFTTDTPKHWDAPNVVPRA
ncbi:MAG: N4-gp56 family major capsid protein [Peptostreptococcaceae bacterium]